MFTRTIITGLVTVLIAGGLIWVLGFSRSPAQSGPEPTKQTAPPKEKAPSARPLLAQAPALLGTVLDVKFPGEEISGTPLLEVQTWRGEILIPLAVDICTKIDTAARRIDVTLPEGLRDLNSQ